MQGPNSTLHQLDAANESAAAALSLLQRRRAITSTPHNQIRYTPLEKLRLARPVERIRFIRELCRGKRVLDLGAMDETALAAKRGSGRWLHEEIATSAEQVIGIDSSKMVPPGGIVTAENAQIHQGNIMDLAACFQLIPALKEFRPEVVVAGELIEHLDDPLAFLSQLRRTEDLRGATFVLSTPNATAVHNCLIALTGRESTHHDHLAIFSFKTLSTICHRAGFDERDIRPYFSAFTEMKSRQRGIGELLVSAGEKGINCIEWLCPMVGFGYLVVTKFK
jgi:2-polyprenyl-3-methyl-5-hydroxy-6-metoxy-1,4-benzoquinol methylase